MADFDVSTTSDGDSVIIYIRRDSGYDTFTTSIYGGTFGAELDQIRNRKRISNIIDRSGEGTHPQFIYHMFSEYDSNESGIGVLPPYINPKKEQSRLDLYYRLADPIKIQFLMILQEHIRESLEKRIRIDKDTRDEIVKVVETRLNKGADSGLPELIASYAVGPKPIGARRKRRMTKRRNRKARKTRKH